jgi:hypothetical protein
LYYLSRYAFEDILDLVLLSFEAIAFFSGLDRIDKPGNNDDKVRRKSMKVLFIGGTGVISSACSQLAVDRGIELFILNRGQTDRPIPEGAHQILGDIRQPETIREILKNNHFDVVVDWVAFTPEHVETDIQLFSGCTGQYIFIGTAAAYAPPSLPITESTDPCKSTLGLCASENIVRTTFISSIHRESISNHCCETFPHLRSNNAAGPISLYGR